MKRLFLLLGILAMPSFAAVSANVSFASDYVWRGMTQSDGPAIQGGLTLKLNQVFTLVFGGQTSILMMEQVVN